MGNTPVQIIFYILAAMIVASSIFAVTAKRMLRAATCLLFVLIGTAGIYLLLNYHFLAAVQLAVYAGGILILFIFAILLTNAKGDQPEKRDRRKILAGIVAAVAGIAVTLATLMKHKFLYGPNRTIFGDFEVDMQDIGRALMSTEKYGYLLTFEALSVLLLAAIIGGIVIGRKR